MSFYQSSEGGMASLSQSSNSRSCRPTWWHENQNTAALQQHFGFYKTKYTPLPTTQLNNVRPFTDSISSQRLIRKDTSSIKVGQGPTTSQSDTTEPPWPTVSSLETMPHTGRLIFSSTLSLLLCDKQADPHDPNAEQLLLSWDALPDLLNIATLAGEVSVFVSAWAHTELSAVLNIIRPCTPE